MSYLPIEDHGIIGDMHTVALLGMNGVIDFMAFPHFDSPTIFASLLDDQKGGYFSVAPRLDQAKPRQMYLPDTNVLLTRFLADDGVAELSDFMPIEGGEAGLHQVVRRAKSVQGDIDFEMECRPRFDYGRAGHRIERTNDGVLFIPDDEERLPVLRLRSSLPITIHEGDAIARFRLATGQTASFVLEQVAGRTASPFERIDHVKTCFKATADYWRSWAQRSQYQGRWREMVTRSALTLKLMTFKPSGSVVAAATFGLPETVGGERNWDYRFTWIRDASFTINALLILGYREEAQAFMKWIEQRCNSLSCGSALQIMYGICGETELTETILENFDGYRHSRPVRIGNAAYSQLQLDIYGELLDAVYLYDRYAEAVHHSLWLRLQELVDWVTRNWREPDEGIWEVRGGRKEFLYSRLMCWVAIDRGIKIARSRSFPAPIDKWRKCRDDIYHFIFNELWDSDRKAFVQHRGTKRMDAANLRMPLVDFISPTDPYWLSTLKAIREDLVSDSFVYRYRVNGSTFEGVRGDEGTFVMCSFWLVECLANSGDVLQARFIFEKLLTYSNHLGLFAEELGPRGEHLGNFPQAFTHLGLINAAYTLDKALNRHPELDGPRKSDV